MSKLSFRARALDASKALPIYKADEIPDLPDFAAINRAVPQMPTGMEKEEETEHHLQRALSAQQVYGTSEALVIPIPEIDYIDKRYYELYKPQKDFKPPKQYVHVQPFGLDQEIPDYDMDSEDETWLNKQVKKMEVTPLKFENMMDRLEKGSGQMVVTLQEAKMLLREDDDLTIAVYDYWLNKRLRMQRALIPHVKTEKRDGSTTNNPYVAFRRRTEKMQTRKNRKNDEVSYEKMLKLKRDLGKALTILELMKRREKSKKELLKLTIEIVEKRYQMGDWSSSALEEALSLRHKIPSYLPLAPAQFINKDWSTTKDDHKKKREYKKRKHKTGIGRSLPPQPSLQPPYHLDVIENEATSEEDVPSPQLLSEAEPELDDDPDGVYAFRRRADCSYHMPINDGLGNWPWFGNKDGGLGDKKFRYNLTSLSSSNGRCVGFARRRIGRGGRVILDRGYSEWDDDLSQLNLTDNSIRESSSFSPMSRNGKRRSNLSELLDHIKKARIPHFRPHTPTSEECLAPLRSSSFSGGVDTVSTTSANHCVTSEFNVDSFNSHQEDLAIMQRKQQSQQLFTDSQPQQIFGSSSLNAASLLRNRIVDGGNLTLASSRPATPRSTPSSNAAVTQVTVDSAGAQFAVSALRCDGLSLPTCSSHTGSNSSTLSPVVTISTVTRVTTVTPDINLPLNVQRLTTPIDSSGVTQTAFLTNGPTRIKTSKLKGFSTSPSPTVLQLNSPLPTTLTSALSTTRVISNTSASLPFVGIAAAPLARRENGLTFTGVSCPASPVTIQTANKVSHMNSVTSAAVSSSIVLSASPFVTSTTTTQMNNSSTVTSQSSSSLIKIGFPAVTQSETVNRESHEVHTLVKDKSVPMEVT